MFVVGVGPERILYILGLLTGFFRSSINKAPIVLPDVIDPLLAACSLESMLFRRQREGVLVGCHVVNIALYNAHRVVGRDTLELLFLWLAAEDVFRGDTVSANFWQALLLSLGFREGCIVVLDCLEGGNFLFDRWQMRHKVAVTIAAFCSVHHLRGLDATMIQCLS